MYRIVVLVVGFSLMVTACGTVDAGASPPPPTTATPRVITVSLSDRPIVGVPPTPDPPLDPGIVEPQVLLASAFVTAVEVEMTGDGIARFTLTGDVPTPCHELRTELLPPNPEREVFLEVYSAAPVDQMCIQVMSPFTAQVQLDRLGAGDYTLVIAGTEVTTFTIPANLASSDPRPITAEVEALP